MTRLFTTMWLAALLCLGTAHAANLQTYSFDDPSKEALFRELINEIRCPKCQNQTIADSDADLAKDLRDRTYLMVQEGATKQEVVDYMVARYGDFAYYRPPVQTSTLVLWLGPLVVVLAGAGVILWRVRSRGNTDIGLSTDEQAQLAKLRGTSSPTVDTNADTNADKDKGDPS
jgi:cytochrome c-type biogenesis protein CcmH